MSGISYGSHEHSSAALCIGSVCGVEIQAAYLEEVPVGPNKSAALGSCRLLFCGGCDDAAGFCTAGGNCVCCCCCCCGDEAACSASDSSDEP